MSAATLRVAVPDASITILDLETQPPPAREVAEEFRAIPFP